ncbi:MAG: hypothetical protein IT431_12260 [Phycisphaerales bacterium]|nr:hypothetical protein [Phycisphaerales bacterium]
MTHRPSAGKPGGPRLGDDERHTLRVIASWRQTAADEVDNIGAWRDADPGDRLHKFWSDPARHKDTEHGSTMPRGFESDTTYLLGRFWDDDPKRDLTAIRDVYAAISAWHADRSAERIPDQRVLDQTLEQAMLVVRAVESQLVRSVRRSNPGGNPGWEADRDRLRYLVREMKHRIAGAAAWGRMSEVLGLQTEAETLAIKLGFPGAPLTLIWHRQGEAGFESHVPVDVPDAVAVLKYVRHDPLGAFSIGVIGCTRPGEVRGERVFIEVDFGFNPWKSDAIKSLEAWERAIDGMRADGGQPFRHPRSAALSEAMGEATRACAMYAVALMMLSEPIEGAAPTAESAQSAYVPPEQCLPPRVPELIDKRAQWEACRDTLDAGVKERFRRLDMYFVTRMEADQAATRCQAAADQAADELRDNGEPASKQFATRVRSLLARLRDRVRPWYESGPLMSPDNPGGFPRDPAGEAAAIQESCKGLRLLVAEIRPIAEQRRGWAGGDKHDAVVRPTPLEEESAPLPQPEKALPEPTPSTVKLNEAQRRAGESFEWISAAHPELSPPEDSARPYCSAQWEYLREHGCPAYPMDAAGNPEVPSQGTWERYVRAWLRAQNGPQRSSRTGRPIGKSIVRASEIELQRRDPNDGADS